MRFEKEDEQCKNSPTLKLALKNKRNGKKRQSQVSKGQEREKKN
jgi:hypothetical protein